MPQVCGDSDGADEDTPDMADALAADRIRLYGLCNAVISDDDKSGELISL
ncbi:MAG: hypothetical protein AAGF95_20710 [Chloroflexota bacterium]